ncbi:MAG: Gfo/Idh/MocA family oxidoreductase, partial [Ignavibacterium sp.]|nr:Gfo/Idh/MocA family oxidoreductase [Ignavibacterium sp.]MDW8376165.1 Gfo/Idh/MocA family oxidoreductase [Ignavibacteriales bacterium]
EKFGFISYSSKPEEVLEDKNINTVFIVTHHSTHGKYVIETLKKGKNVFVEKPLCINENELIEIKRVYENSNVKLMVGFNRRFSKQFGLIKEFFKDTKEPYLINYRVNAGFIKSEHWTQRIEEGGRLIGEGCHFIDIFDFMIEDEVKDFTIKSLDNKVNKNIINDNIIITVKYKNGSLANLIYHSNGDKGIEKEYCEIHSGGKSARLIDFKEVQLSKNGKLKKYRFDGKKGHKEEIDIFYKSLVENSDTNLSFESIYRTTFLTIEATKLLKNEYQ